MRIALVTRRFDPAGGGTERDLIVTADFLRHAGHDLTVYADEIRGTTPDLKVRKVGGLALPRALALLRLGLSAARIARNDGAELVLSFARIIDADILRSGGGAHVSYVRAAQRWRGRASAVMMRVSPYHRVQMMLERRGFASERLRRAVAVSNLVRDDLIRRFALKPEVAVTIYNGVSETFRALDAGARAAVRVEFKIPRDVPLVAFVGNGFARKGLRGLIEALPLLSMPVALLVVGTDRRVKEYRSLAAELKVGERVIFAGHQPRVERVIASADALALPSRFEPFGNVALEALACGVPVLTSACCGVAEILPPPLRPYVVERPDQPGEIALRLGELLRIGTNLAEVARATAAQFTWERYGRELLALIDSIR